MSRRPWFRLPSGKPRVSAFRFGRTARLWLPVPGVAPGNSRVEVVGGQVLIRYGPWRATVDWRNIRAVTASGPFKAWKALGPRAGGRPS
jgi:hypothetical protein